LLSFSVSRVSGLAISNSPDAPKKIEFSIQLDAGKHVDLKIALAAKRDDMERKKGKGAGRQTETLTGDKPNCDFSWWPNGYERRKLLDNMFVVLSWFITQWMQINRAMLRQSGSACQQE
jgi:hypothetical protein